VVAVGNNRIGEDKTYLGDAVYAEHDGFNIWLWTSDGITDSSKIALEPSVLDALIAYREQLLTRVRVARETSDEDGA